MAFQASETRTYDSLLSTTLANWAAGMEDTISTANKFFYAIRRSGSYKSVDALGERARYSLRTDQNSTANVYGGYDPIDVTPQEGMTAAFYNWTQMAVSISISRIEERKNSGEMAMLDLLEEKIDQASDSINELWAKATFLGNGVNSATAITTPFTSTLTGRTWFTPLALLVSTSPTTGTVGGIPNNSTNNTGVTFWANQRRAATDTNFSSFFADLDGLRNDCSKGVGGPPDMHFVDQNTYQFYCKALRTFHHNTSYARADIPFENVLFYGQPVMWDEYMPNSSGTTTVLSTTQGTWYMLNSKFLQIKYDSQTNFITTPFVRPENQDAKTAQILWYGTLGTGNRRKHGVLDDINTTLTS